MSHQGTCDNTIGQRASAAPDGPREPSGAFAPDAGGDPAGRSHEDLRGRPYRGARPSGRREPCGKGGPAGLPIRMRPAPVVAGPGCGGDVIWTSLRRRHGDVDAADAIARIRRDRGEALVVEPFSAVDLPAIRAAADGVVIGAAWMQDFRLLREAARTGLTVIIQRGPAATLDEWLSAAEYCRAEGNDAIILCESGTRTHHPHVTLDLALLRTARERGGLPVFADVSAAPELAVAALSAGADGLLLAEDASPELTAEVRDRVAVLGPLLSPGSTDSLAAARASIDQVDAAIATLLERRTQLAGLIQRMKPVAGFAGRDPRREDEIVAAMVPRAPTLGAERLARIMNVVIEAGLEVHEPARRHAGN